MDSLPFLVASRDNIVLARSDDINLNHCNYPVIIHINLVHGQLCYEISRQQIIHEIFDDYT